MYQYHFKLLHHDTTGESISGAAKYLWYLVTAIQTYKSFWSFIFHVLMI